VNSDSSIARIVLAVLATLVLGLPGAMASDLDSDPAYAALFAFVRQLDTGTADGANDVTRASGLFFAYHHGRSSFDQADSGSFARLDLHAAVGASYQAAGTPGPHHRFFHHVALSTAVDLPEAVEADQPTLVSLDGVANPHAQWEQADDAALRDYARQIGIEGPMSRDIAEADHSPWGPGGTELAALRDYALQVGVAAPDSAAAPPLRLAEADNALDALREWLRGNQQPEPAPGETPDSVPRATPNRRAPPAQSGPVAPLRAPHFGEAHNLGTTTCLICHTSQAAAFGGTLMGRIGKTQTSKFDCENCHGPASVHVKAGGCAACHGDDVSKRTGIPTLAGQHPEYLVPAMKAYVTRQRRHPLMNEILAGVAEADLQGIARYYAGQTPFRAHTPPVSDAAAGRVASALCMSCHGEQGISVSPLWPSLAGQDAQYLASAIREYQNGSRSKVVACAGCHGENGVSKRPGIPSLAGETPQALVRAMKGYIAGERKHPLMQTMLSGLSDAELNKIALHFARQTPARTSFPPIGDVAAGKKISEDCATCHGDEGIADNPKFPNVAGQDARYLAGALRAYKAKSRTIGAMQKAAADLDERAIDDVASYFASLAPEQPELTEAEKKAPVTPDPVVVKNSILASLDERAINNIASYFSSLQPGRSGPGNAKGVPVAQQPPLVGQAPHPGGRSLGGIISFRNNDPGRKAEDNNAICLGCHERGDRTYWSGSVHETRGVACTECHTIMRSVSRKANLKTESELDTCFQCHKDRRAQLFRSSHMPLREGKMVCSSCHNPHGSATEALLIANSINETCYKCHAEKRGPFLFEHTPVRENCLNCHDPHGSVNEYLLKVSRPRLCGECHTVDHGAAIAGGPAVVQAFSRSCQNCHSKVHGSNSPSGALLQR
jgi:DmsE family decaheme c-type cytochrome